MLQVIKDNRIQVRAKHEEKTTERLCKSKYAREYELGEKIETLSLTGGLSSDGRLYVGAFVKGQGGGGGGGGQALAVDAEAKTDAPDAGGDAGDASNPVTASTDDNDGDTPAAAAEALQPCTVLAVGGTSAGTSTVGASVTSSN